jgi:hypothetical protein
MVAVDRMSGTMARETRTRAASPTMRHPPGTAEILPHP